LKPKPLEPMQLTDIQKLQFSNKGKAEEELLDFLRRNEDPSIQKAELLPKPESLNSINGFLTYADGERFFFKAHVEENEKLSEYYNAETLIRARYPLITAKQITHRPGKQLVLYQIVSLPTLFDLIKIEEDAQIKGEPESERARALLRGQEELDKLVCLIYKETLQELDAVRQANAPIHQLFSHRLAEDGRLGIFYRDKVLELGDGSITFGDLAKLRWRINGVEYHENLGQIVERSRTMLAPQAGPSVIGHGDAHNGNVFVDLESGSFKMFDPAFAGEHNPLLDMVKPLFHNVFARWMYYPEQMEKEFELSYRIRDGEIAIEHSYQPSDLRLSHFQSRKENLLRPTIDYLRQRDLLIVNWQDYLRSALFCCPFLTVNLFAKNIPGGTLSERYSSKIKLLGLSMSMEFGSSAHEGTSRLADTIDDMLA